MPNLTGLSDEEARRIQALSDKTKAEFAKAQSGEKARAPSAPVGRPKQVDATLNHVLTPNGQTRMEKTPQGQQREDEAKANAERIRQRTI